MSSAELGGTSAVFFITNWYFPAAPAVLIVGRLSPDDAVLVRAMGAAPSGFGTLVTTLEKFFSQIRELRNVAWRVLGDRLRLGRMGEQRC